MTCWKCWPSHAVRLRAPVVPLPGSRILNRVLMISTFSVVNRKVLSELIAIMYVKMLWKSIKHYKNLKLHWVIILIITVVFWAWENAFHSSCFLSFQTKKAANKTFPSSSMSSFGEARKSGQWPSSQKYSKIWTHRNHWAMGRKESTKCHIDILPVVGLLLSNLALSQLAFQRDFIPLVVCALPTLILGSQRGARVIQCSSGFVIPFMPWSDCMWIGSVFLFRFKTTPQTLGSVLGRL